MNKLIYKNWWVWGGIAVVVMSPAFTPQILDKLYIMNGFFFTTTTFKKEELLLFYGSFLSFLGPIVLSSFALWQNKSINEGNNIRQDELIERNNKLSLSSNISCENSPITSCHIKAVEDPKNDEANFKFLSLKIKNLNDNPLRDFRIYSTSQSIRFILYLIKGEEKNIKIELPKTEQFFIEFSSCYGIQTYGKMDIEYDEVNDCLKIKDYSFRGIDKPKTQRFKVEHSIRNSHSI